MRAHLKYISYVIRHKWFVFVAGLRTGAPLWRLIIHDWSKFTPAEWGPYVRKFYGGPYPTSIANLTPMLGDSDWPPVTQEVVDTAFDRAWLHHQHTNPHHWQHWVLREDDGDTKILPMPESFLREMVADWMGAGRAITGRWEATEWYEKNRDKMLLHPGARALAESLLAGGSE